MISQKQDVAFSYEHTKAICEKNTCRDYIVTCANKKVISIAPISGFVTFSENWQDTREKTPLC